jgi:hypothetical protein
MNAQVNCIKNDIKIYIKTALTSTSEECCARVPAHTHTHIQQGPININHIEMQPYTGIYYVTQFIYIWKLLYMFRVVFPPIIRSADNCIYSIWYLSHRYCYLPLSWKCWNRFECAVGGISHPQHTQKYLIVNYANLTTLRKWCSLK